MFTESLSRDQVMQRAYSNRAHLSLGICHFVLEKLQMPHIGGGRFVQKPHHFPVYLSCICHIYGPHRAATYFCLEIVRELDLFGSLPVPSPRRVASYPAM